MLYTRGNMVDVRRVPKVARPDKAPKHCSLFVAECQANDRNWAQKLSASIARQIEVELKPMYQADMIGRWLVTDVDRRKVRVAVWVEWSKLEAWTGTPVDVVELPTPAQ